MMCANVSDNFPESKELNAKTDDFADITIFEGSHKLDGGGDALEDDLLADPDNCGICGYDF